jgi:hypothetical protein
MGVYWVCQEGSVIESSANLGMHGQGLLKLSGHGDSLRAQRLLFRCSTLSMRVVNWVTNAINTCFSWMFPVWHVWVISKKVSIMTEDLVMFDVMHSSLLIDIDFFAQVAEGAMMQAPVEADSPIKDE